MNFQKSKKVYALYLSVAFFFALFSFGKDVLAFTLYSNTPVLDTEGGMDVNFTNDFEGTILYAWQYVVGVTGLANGGDTVYWSISDDHEATNLDCETEHKTATEWGIPIDTADFENTALIRIGPFSGTECNLDDTTEYTLNFSNGGTYTAGAGDTGTWLVISDNGDPVIGTETTIYTVTPENGSTISTSSIKIIGATGFLAQEDFNDYSSLKIHIENSNASFFQCADVICADFANGSIILDFYYPLVISSYFDYSSTTMNLPIGKYYVTSKITKGSLCFLGYCATTSTVFSTTTSFVVSTTTKLDKIKDSASQTVNDLSSTNNNFEDCSVTSFSFLQCMSDLMLYAFVPTQSEINGFGTTLHDNVLTHFPLGYITDFVSIISTTTASTLTVFDAIVPAGIPGTGSHISLDLNHVLDPYLNATTGSFRNSSASSTETLFVITNRYWAYIVYILTLFYILGRILGTHLIPRIRNKIHDN